MLRQKPDPSPPYAGARTADNRIDPSPATSDKNEMKQLPSRNEADYAGKELSLKKGGKVKATGPVKVHKDEFVVKKAAAQKQGAKKMAALNAGKAKVVPKAAPKRGKR